MRTLSRLKLILLPIGLVVIAVLAFTTAKEPTTKAADYPAVTFQSLVDAALSDFKANDANASSAPQQQVVAGWATKDLLVASGYQNASQILGLGTVNSNLVGLIDASNKNHSPRLLLLAILALCWIGLWSVVPGYRPDPADPQAVSPIEA